MKSCSALLYDGRAVQSYACCPLIYMPVAVPFWYKSTRHNVARGCCDTCVNPTGTYVYTACVAYPVHLSHGIPDVNFKKSFPVHHRCYACVACNDIFTDINATMSPMLVSSGHGTSNGSKTKFVFFNRIPSKALFHDSFHPVDWKGRACFWITATSSRKNTIH
jgi:hypothetical protein